jgi:crotonobetaine/carnitine-CoA ligase
MGASGMSETTRHRVAVGDLLASWAARRPDRLCAAMDDREYTFAELDGIADRLHAGMAAFEVHPGDRVATLAPNRSELLELFAGLARAGAIQVPLNAYLKGTFLQHQLGQSRSRVLVVDRSGRASIEPLLAELPDLETIIHLDEPDRELVARSGRREIQYSELTSTGEHRAAANVSAADTMAIIYTSGTTGLPKGCVLSHGYYCRCGELNAAALELTDEDVLFASLPLFHAGALLIVLMGALNRGVPARFESSFSASAFFGRARVTEATVAIGVGAMGAALLARQSSTADREHRLRTMMVAPMAPEAQNRFRDRFGIEPWTEVFGQTECMPITMTPLSFVARDADGCGLPAPDLDFALLDDAGDLVPDGAVGEICVRPLHDPYSLFDGYWTQEARVAAPFDDGWHHTGDSGRRLPTGSIAFVDRKKDSMRRRGENVSSVELETAINTHPDVLECATHAVASQMADDDIKVCLVLAEGADFDPIEFFAFARSVLPYFAIPRYVEVVPALPRNAVGRVMKHALREAPHTVHTVDLEALGLTVGRAERR